MKTCIGTQQVFVVYFVYFPALQGCKAGKGAVKKYISSPQCWLHGYGLAALYVT